MTARKQARERLSYVVPGYIWQHPHFKINWEPALPIIEAGQGIIVIDSQSMPMREYAATSLLSLLQRRDYYADIGWTSFFPRAENEFTGSTPVPKHRPLQVIAVKPELTSLTEQQVEQIQDFAVSCQLAIVAAYQLELTVAYTRIKINASKGETVNI